VRRTTTFGQPSHSLSCGGVCGAGSRLKERATPWGVSGERIASGGIEGEEVIDGAQNHEANLLGP
jgi:hypothetical protein